MNSTFLDELGLVSEEELKRKGVWRNLTETEKASARGSIEESQQEELALSSPESPNLQLPVSSGAVKSSQETPTSELPVPGLHEPEDPNRVHYKSRHRDKQLKQALTSSYTSLYAEFLRSKTPEKPHKELQNPFIHHHPKIPKNLEQKIAEFYPDFHSFLAKLLYLRDNRKWKISSIAFALYSSEPQIERYYVFARFLYVLKQRAKQHA